MNIPLSHDPEQQLSATERLRILTFTTLYPGGAQPNHGVFVENRLRHLLATGRVEARVMAPVPWFPSTASRFGRYALLARMPQQETRNGIDVVHPRYPALPKLGMSVSPALLFAATLLPAWRRQAEFDLIDAHYFYPDGVAAVMLGQSLKKPVVITARGTDINLIPRYPFPRRMIAYAARRAAGIIAVSQALKDEMISIGVAADRISVLRNGVDLELFTPGDRSAAQAALGLTGRTLLSVGLLIERKGHDLVISALPQLADCTLLIVGEGQELARLKALAQSLGIETRVRFLGAVPHQELRKIYVAADALVLASSREGWPNVLLEAMACGTPVVASAVWGNPEIVSVPQAGILMRERSATGVAEAVEQLFGDLPSREATRAFAERFSWDDTSAGQIRLFREVLARHSADGLREHLPLNA
ncbi:MAG TPA: glycosyltransferase family 4 protein [Rhizomicrobium sp.]|jgi:glycosyltransferase involved in cell wall biosynthesis|nr:glycosyltransferase family 4 protein [Rhizomicrobium sp.]